jgi:RHS repeat-associated protein
VVSYTYDPWGKFTGSSTSTLGEMLLDYNCLTYRGYYYDEYIGMYYLQSRFYDPNIGRFINADAADYADLAAVSLSDTNLFAYCRNNPVMHEDSQGTLTAVAAAMIAGAITGAAWGAISAAMTGASFNEVVSASLIGAATGGLAGAACVTTAISIGFKVVCGATLGVLNYIYTTPEDDLNLIGFLSSAAIGGATLFAGTFLPSVTSINVNLAETYTISGVGTLAQTGVSYASTYTKNSVASTSGSTSHSASKISRPHKNAVKLKKVASSASNIGSRNINAKNHLLIM